jgi:hypothetical protein
MVANTIVSQGPSRKTICAFLTLCVRDALVAFGFTFEQANSKTGD